MNDLVSRLASADHPVVVGGIEPTPADFVERLTELKYVLIRFPGTRGGTELSFPLDSAGTELGGGDLTGYTGTVHLEGDLVLDLQPVRCVADIDLTTLAGTGRLVIHAN